MRVPSVSRHEDMMQEFLLEWAKKHGCSAKKDGKGNIFLTKGKPPSGHYFCGFCNHVDTVHSDQEEMVKQRVYKEIVWEGDKVTAINPLLPKHGGFSSGYATSWNKDDKDEDDIIDVEQNEDGTYEVKDEKPEEKKPEEKKPEEKKQEKPVEMGRQTGLGMDDQGGCAIALAVIDSIPFAKAAFFVEEEVGMQGSRAADMHFFDDCAFVFSNDSPDRNRGTHYSSGVQLYSDEFFKEHLQKICADHGLTDFRSEPYTDILNVRNHVLPNGKHLECLNFGNGGYNAHMDTEYAKFSDVCAAEELLRALCTKIPLDKQYSSDIGEEPRSWGGYGRSYSGYGSYGGYSGYGSGYSSWRAAQNRDDDDDWWASITGKKPAAPAGKDFPDRSAWDEGVFSFKFKKADFASTAALALRRLQKTTGQDRMEFERSGDMITVEGDLISMRYAYMACFNAENQTKYANWDDFLKKVPGAKDAFEKAVSFEDDEDEDDGKMSHGDRDWCSLNIYMDGDEADAFRAMIKNGPLKDVDVDIDDDRGSFTVEGALEDVKKTWAGACAAEQGTAVRDFKDLDAADQESFWDDVEFDDSPAPDGRKSLDDEEPDDTPSNDVDDFWKWWNSEGGGREG